jgi:hypothetical protein
LSLRRVKVVKAKQTRTLLCKKKTEIKLITADEIAKCKAEEKM